mmetsp:Transcript_3762/g.11636  ORF Transcript_3762/g.11636 Transcript_3762/m.11636 type:complete len:201 (-) Transcript_3762:371-973(-)
MSSYVTSSRHLKKKKRLRAMSLALRTSSFIFGGMSKCTLQKRASSNNCDGGEEGEDAFGEEDEVGVGEWRVLEVEDEAGEHLGEGEAVVAGLALVGGEGGGDGAEGVEDGLAARDEAAATIAHGVDELEREPRREAVQTAQHRRTQRRLQPHQHHRRLHRLLQRLVAPALHQICVGVVSRVFFLRVAHPSRGSEATCVLL